MADDPLAAGDPCAAARASAADGGSAEGCTADGAATGVYAEDNTATSRITRPVDSAAAVRIVGLDKTTRPHIGALAATGGGGKTYIK